MTTTLTDTNKFKRQKFDYQLKLWYNYTKYERVLIFPLWFCKLLKPIEYKTDKEYGEGYYGHWYGYPVYYVPNEIPEE